MQDGEWLANRFEEHRGRLWALAYGMLGSLAEADDAVQDAWLRVTGAGASEVEDLDGWLTWIVARVCLKMLRSRSLHDEEPLRVHVPDLVVSTLAAAGPEDEVFRTDSVDPALLVVLDTLTPAERLVFVLHDMFDRPFEEIAPMVGQTPAAAKQLASKVRRRVNGACVPAPVRDLARQQEVVDTFCSAPGAGAIDTLVSLLDPDVVLRIDAGPSRPGTLAEGSAALKRQGYRGLRELIGAPAVGLLPAVVSGAAGVIITMEGEPIAVMGLTVTLGKVVRVDVIADPDRVRTLT